MTSWDEKMWWPRAEYQSLLYLNCSSWTTIVVSRKDSRICHRRREMIVKNSCWFFSVFFLFVQTLNCSLLVYYQWYFYTVYHTRHDIPRASRERTVQSWRRSHFSLQTSLIGWREKVWTVLRILSLEPKRTTLNICTVMRLACCSEGVLVCIFVHTVLCESQDSWCETTSKTCLVHQKTALIWLTIPLMNCLGIKDRVEEREQICKWLLSSLTGSVFRSETKSLRLEEQIDQWNGGLSSLWSPTTRSVYSRIYQDLLLSKSL